MKNIIKDPLRLALAVVGVLCIIFAITAAALSSSLKDEKLKVTSLDKEILMLQKDFDVMMNEQANIINDLQNSLNIAKEEEASLKKSEAE